MAQVRAIAADSVAWSACVTVSLLVTTTRPTKMDEPIEMMFGERLVWLKKNHALDGKLDPCGIGTL